MTLIINTSDKTLRKNLYEYTDGGVVTVDSRNIFLVSNLLAEYVVNNVDDKVITKIIKSDNDIDNICEFKKYFYIKIKDYMNRKLRLYDIISEALENSSYINFDGFIKFRLNDYYKLIKNIIVEIKEDYFAHREYENFIYLIKELIKRQATIVYNLHISVEINGKYKIFDEYYNDITRICIDEFLEEYDYKYINNDDFLFSTVLSLAPKKITFHNFKRITNKELISTLTDIYNENIIFCETCFLCEKNK